MTPLLNRPRQTACFVLAIIGLVLAGFVAAPAAAQSNKASIVGVVRDPSGAVVPGAKVTATNVATNQSRTVETNGEGAYVIPILDIGSYTIEGSADGFAGGKVEDVVLQVGDRIAVDLTLGVAGGSEVVTITASDEPLLQRESSSRGDVITGRQLVELPLSGRNFTALATLTPGVTRGAVGPLSDQTAFNQGDPNGGSVPGLGDSRGSTEAARFSRSGGAVISANGQRPTNNNFSLDGVDNNEATFGTIGVYPAPDAIAEFKVETSVPRAETGRAAGAVINTTFRSGTNEFHGSAYYYGQNSRLNATNSIVKRSGLEKPTTQIHEFGVTVGGPIFKDRTFFFGDYLGQRNNIPHFFQTTVPTALTRQGNFSEFDSPVIDPATGEPFRNNIIPNLQGRRDFSNAAFLFLNDYPLPTINIRNPSAGNPNFFGNRANTEEIDSFDIKIDHRISDNNTINGRYSQSDQKRVRANFFPKIPTAGFGAGDEQGNTRQITINDVHTFSPTVLNEFRFGWTRIEIGILNTGIEGTQGISPTYSADIGIPNVNRGTPETTGGLLTGGFGTGEFEFSGDGGPFTVESDNFYFADSLTMVRGGHTFKFGGELRYRMTDIIDGGRSGFLKGHLQYAAGGPGSTGNVQADYLLARPAVFAQAGDVPGGPFDLRQTELSFFVQDDWKVSDRLTLNYGLRYDLFPASNEKSGRTSNYDLTSGKVIVADGTDLIDTDKNNFGPRVGFAYTFGPEERFVLRGGYGLVYTLDGLDYPPLIRNPPFTNEIREGPFAGGSGQFNFITGPPVATAGVDPNNVPTTAAVYFLQPDQRTAYVHQYNLTVQWAFADNWVIDVAYVGNRSRGLLTTRNIGANGFGIAKNAAGQTINSVRAYENRAKSWYDGLQVQLQRRLADGFQFRASYTWSKTLDQSTGVFNGAGEIRGNDGGPQNPLDLNLDQEKGLSSLHAKHLFSSNLIYELPFGRGRRFLDEGGAVDQVVGGWQVNFIFSARSGQPFTVNAGDGVRADILAEEPYTSFPDGTVYLNRNAFGFPGLQVRNVAGNAFTIGNSARNGFEGPGYFRTDMSFLKNFPINETMHLEFGMQFFNLFNQADYLVPQTDIRNSDFGRFNNVLPPRIIQYRARFVF